RDRLPELAGRLDGLPLALELAAARLRVLSVAELVGRLDDVLTTPSTVDGGRHATLHAAVTWSYRTLPPGAARLMRWLSVFAGRVQLATVEWLLDEDALGALSMLVDKSLVQAEVTPSGTTYRLLEPVRVYAARRPRRCGSYREPTPPPSAVATRGCWPGYAVDTPGTCAASVSLPSRSRSAARSSSTRTTTTSSRRRCRPCTGSPSCSGGAARW